MHYICFMHFSHSNGGPAAVGCRLTTHCTIFDICAVCSGVAYFAVVGLPSLTFFTMCNYFLSMCCLTSFIE